MEIWEVNRVHNNNHFPNNETKNDHNIEEQAIIGGKENGKEHSCEKVRIHQDDGISFWASCDPYDDECNRGCSKERIGNMSYYWTSTNDSERCELP